MSASCVLGGMSKREQSSDTVSTFDRSEGASSCDEAVEVPRQDLYSLLLGPSHVGTASILFAWWPTAEAWSHNELIERCTRCLPGARPGVDLVALPRLGEVEELWAAWAAQQGLGAWQALWFDPFPQHCASRAAPTPPELALDEVVAALPAHTALGSTFFYPMYLTSAMAVACERYGMPAVGDAADHRICQLGCAKAWLHPHVNPRKRVPSLRNVLPAASAGPAAAVRGPWGYIASSTEELREAMRRLRGELPCGTRLVLKPSWASGGDGIILNVKEEQLGSFDFPPGEEHTAILEEFVEGRGDSPTLYMLAAEPCGPLADQILADNGTVNDGNRWPSVLASEQLTQKCVAAAKDIQRVWGLSSQWGLDFVVDRHGTPIIVDLNMGRPNGNFSVRLWESRFCQHLYMHTSSWKPPAGITAKVLFGALQKRGLAWDPGSLQGVLVYQHFHGQSSSYVVASASSWENVDSYVGRLQVLMAELSDGGSGDSA